MFQYVFTIAQKVCKRKLKLPAAPLKRDLRFAPTSCGVSARCCSSKPKWSKLDIWSIKCMTWPA